MKPATNCVSCPEITFGGTGFQEWTDRQPDRCTSQSDMMSPFLQPKGGTKPPPPTILPQSDVAEIRRVSAAHHETSEMRQQLFSEISAGKNLHSSKKRAQKQFRLLKRFQSCSQISDAWVVYTGKSDSQARVWTSFRLLSEQARKRFRLQLRFISNCFVSKQNFQLILKQHDTCRGKSWCSWFRNFLQDGSIHAARSSTTPLLTLKHDIPRGDSQCSWSRDFLQDSSIHLAYVFQLPSFMLKQHDATYPEESHNVHGPVALCEKRTMKKVSSLAKMSTKTKCQFILCNETILLACFFGKITGVFWLLLEFQNLDSSKGYFPMFLSIYKFSMHLETTHPDTRTSHNVHNKDLFCERELNLRSCVFFNS